MCVLTWDNRRMLVVISAYRSDYIKAYEIGYSITFSVVRNEADFVDAVPAVTPVQQLKIDSQQLNNMAACAGIASISGYATSIFAGIKTVEAAAQPIAKGLQSITSTVGQAANCAASIGNQVTATVSAVAAPIAQLLANTQRLISNTESAIINAATFGGIVPGNPLAATVGTYISQLNSAVQLPAIYEIQSVAQRMQKNLQLAANPSSYKTVTVGGGSLYDVAAQQYGDGTRWNEIAAANNLSDPMITGITTLVIP